MPKNINYITIIITLEGIEKIKTEKNDNKTVWTITREFTSWMTFIFPLWKHAIHQAKLEITKLQLEITKACHLSFQNLLKTWKPWSYYRRYWHQKLLLKETDDLECLNKHVSYLWHQIMDTMFTPSSRRVNLLFHFVPQPLSLCLCSASCCM